MAAKRKRVLTPGRMRLAKAMAIHGNIKAAAQTAEMTVQSAYTAMHDPGVQAIIKREQLHKLVVEGVPIAVKALVDIAGDDEERGSTRVMAAKEILHIAQVNPEAITEEALDGATIAELQALLERTKAHNAEHATIVEAEVVELDQAAGALD